MSDLLDTITGRNTVRYSRNVRDGIITGRPKDFDPARSVTFDAATGQARVETVWGNTRIVPASDVLDIGPSVTIRRETW